MRKYFIIFVTIILAANNSFAQYDSIVNNFQNDFDQFKQSIEQEHQQFKNKNDSVFAKFLKDSWQEFDVFYNEKEVQPKPSIQPVLKESQQRETPIQKITPADSSQSNISELIKIEYILENKKLPKERNNSGRAMMHFDFYGTETSTFRLERLPQLSEITAKTISSFFENTCNNKNVIELVDELKTKKNTLLLNDWGYYKLVEKAAQKIEPSTQIQTLLTWEILLKSGYNVKVGYSAHDVFLMLPTKQEIFSSYYLTINDVQYYIQTNRDKDQPLPRLKIHTANFPGNERLSLQLKQLPLLGEQEISKKIEFNDVVFNVTQPQSLKTFYADYPLCDMVVCFFAPLSEQARKSLDKIFIPLFDSKTERQKVSVLLEFVQSAFPYKTDKEQFGTEKYFFPDEIFFYPFSDCEDRSVLFCSLVKYFTGLDCIALDFPGHINTAVCLPGNPKGDYLALAGKNYTVCDPTYKNAPVGYLDTQYKKQKPKIITFEK